NSGRRALLVALLFGLGAALALAGARGTGVAQGGEVYVFAAASLTDAFGELGGLFESQHPGSRVVFNFGPSSGLRTQIEQGARADVFASADQAQMDQARANGVIAGEPRVFARNVLVLVVPRDNPGRITSLEDLARPGLRLVATAPQVPIGAYTRQMLQRLSQDPAYGPDFADRVLANVRSEELDVRAVLAKIVLGEGDGGIVYATDITPQVAPEVHTIAIPEAFNVVATYPIALVQGARQPALGERFIALVLSDAGQAVLARYNFQPVR
ncbi:MAG TPA: molybdate ABC transporter substrate-binding protein, partial [Chloroflexota bacterium]|nr:molybdate ABC transporter substrate-binding protein [Chloroflexota bacterium]